MELRIYYHQNHGLEVAGLVLFILYRGDLKNFFIDTPKKMTHRLFFLTVSSTSKCRAVSITGVR